MPLYKAENHFNQKHEIDDEKPGTNCLFAGCGQLR